MINCLRVSRDLFETIFAFLCDAQTRLSRVLFPRGVPETAFMRALNNIIDARAGELYAAERYSVPPTSVLNFLSLCASLVANEDRSWGKGMRADYSMLVLVGNLWQTDFSQTSCFLRDSVRRFLAQDCKKNQKMLSQLGRDVLEFVRTLPALWEMDPPTQRAVMKLRTDVQKWRFLHVFLTDMLTHLTPTHLRHTMADEYPAPPSQSAPAAVGIGITPAPENRATLRDLYIAHLAEWERRKHRWSKATEELHQLTDTRKHGACALWTLCRPKAEQWAELGRFLEEVRADCAL
ncbi:hypothetical protein PAPYR_3599 [Paratrimastix pyriformis]|uniref:Uncharacterized protein n=1 Tax=Paratrimastix pyriformis TaxID=342808 RepID=A0ABQ8UM13_9EUKA|nr:hypothetical protein PAPYR_3599 [Paratrimastix pyriformis]